MDIRSDLVSMASDFHSISESKDPDALSSRGQAAALVVSIILMSLSQDASITSAERAVARLESLSAKAESGGGGQDDVSVVSSGTASLLQLSIRKICEAYGIPDPTGGA